MQRIDRQIVLDIGKQQFLVLLFVMAAQGRNAYNFHKIGRCRPVQQIYHRRIDMGAIMIDFFDRGTRQQTAIRAWILRTDGLVIGIEEIFE